MNVVDAELDVVRACTGQPEIKIFRFLADLAATSEEEETNRLAIARVLAGCSKTVFSYLYRHENELVGEQIEAYIEGQADG